MSRTLKRYTVEGTGAFPIDMLRYDCAWPAAQTDAREIGDSQVSGVKPLSLSWRVELHSYSKPTTRRWVSFGWQVIEVRS